MKGTKMGIDYNPMLYIGKQFDDLNFIEFCKQYGVTP